MKNAARVCAISNNAQFVTLVVERADLVPGFQHAKDQYVPMPEEELESLEAEANKSIDLKAVRSARISRSSIFREHSLFWRP